LPVIIWKKAALAHFVEENNIGICVGSLAELDQIFSSLTAEQYQAMKNNVINVSDKLAKGYFITKAIEESERALF
jgi:hypothetical protein